MHLKTVSGGYLEPPLSMLEMTIECRTCFMWGGAPKTVSGSAGSFVPQVILDAVQCANVGV